MTKLEQLDIEVAALIDTRLPPHVNEIAAFKLSPALKVLNITGVYDLHLESLSAFLKRTVGRVHDHLPRLKTVTFEALEFCDPEILDEMEEDLVNQFEKVGVDFCIDRAEEEDLWMNEEDDSEYGSDLDPGEDFDFQEEESEWESDDASVD